MNLAVPVLRRPPRPVPFSTRLVVLFGGAFASFGWFFFAFGMVFTWVFAGNADWASAFLFRGPRESVTGRVTASEPTSFSEGGDKHRKGTPVFASRYAFQFGGRDYEGVSYRTGGGPAVGGAVTVEFPAGQPACSRIAGMRRAPLGLGALFVLIFPAVGLGSILPGLWRGRNSIRLLARGVIAQGRLIDKQPTNVSINKQPVFKLTFEFMDASRQSRRAVVKTEQTRRLEDDAAETLFYDPQQPSRCVLLDGLPGRQGFAANGELQPNGFWPGARAVALPLLAFLVVAAGCAWKLLAR